MRFTCVDVHFSVTSFFWRVKRLHGLDDLIDVAEVELVRNLRLEVMVIDAFLRIKTVFFANTFIGFVKFILC